MISDDLFTTARRARLALLVCFIVAGLVLSAVAALGAARGDVEFIELEGVIDPVSARFLLRHIERAGDQASHVLIIRINTPGGLDVSMREMVEAIFASKVPIVVWVAPNGARAASAGVFITQAAHVAVMAPATNLGAAHPVNLGEQLDEVAAEKATNDAAAYIRSIANQRGRNADWAERAVRESVSIEAEEAVRLGVVDFTAGSMATLLDRLDGLEVAVEEGSVRLATLGARIVFHKMSIWERILHTAVRPEVAYLLLLVGFYGLIFELYNPGIGLAGILGGVALILGFYALSILPTSWAGVALLLLAVAFFVVDLQTAGLGVFTVGAIVSLVAGSLILFSGGGPEFRLAWWAIAGAVSASLLFFIGAMTAAIRARLSKPVSGAEGIVGTVGVARTDIAPEGQVMARGTLWRARTGGAAIPKGSRVRVNSVSGLMLVVEQAFETNGSGAVPESD